MWLGNETTEGDGGRRSFLEVRQPHADEANLPTVLEELAQHRADLFDDRLFVARVDAQTPCTSERVEVLETHLDPDRAVGEARVPEARMDVLDEVLRDVPDRPGVPRVLVKCCLAPDA